LFQVYSVPNGNKLKITVFSNNKTSCLLHWFDFKGCIINHFKNSNLTINSINIFLQISTLVLLVIIYNNETVCSVPLIDGSSFQS